MRTHAAMEIAPTPSLLTIPLELRHHIYSYLLPRTPTSHPLPGVGLTSVSHRPPSAAMLNITPQISDEILEYFYTITTWKLIFSHAFNFFRVDPDLKGLERSAALARLRRVEVMFYCDILLLRDYPAHGRASAALDQFHAEIRRRADRACTVLLQAERLRAVSISWIDTTAPIHSHAPPLLESGWLHNSTLLSPLRKLRDCPRPIAFSVGQVSGPPRDWFVRAVQAALDPMVLEEQRRDDRPDAKSDVAQPATLRMLAFDVRQHRHLPRRLSLRYECPQAA